MLELREADPLMDIIRNKRGARSNGIQHYSQYHMDDQSPLFIMEIPAGNTKIRRGLMRVE